MEFYLNDLCKSFKFTKWDEETTKSDLRRFNGPSVKRKAVVMGEDGKYMNKDVVWGAKRRVLCQKKAPSPSKSTYTPAELGGHRFHSLYISTSMSDFRKHLCLCECHDFQKTNI